jgi:hypothetical protein
VRLARLWATFFVDCLLQGFLIATGVVAVWAMGTLTLEVLHPPQATRNVGMAGLRSSGVIDSGADGVLTFTGQPPGGGGTDFDTINLGPITPADVGAIGDSDVIMRIRDNSSDTIFSINADGELKVGAREIPLTKKERELLKETLPQAWRK